MIDWIDVKIGDKVIATDDTEWLAHFISSRGVVFISTKGDDKMAMLNNDLCLYRGTLEGKRGHIDIKTHLKANYIKEGN